MTDDIVRPYTPADVKRLQGRIKVRHTLADHGAFRLRSLLASQPYVRALGAQTGNQAVQMVKAGLRAIYCSGWQVAADANTNGQTYPDQSLYSVDSAPSLVRRINNALLRAEQIDVLEDKPTPYVHWLAPIVADAEAGFGGPLNAYELTKSLIEAGAAGIHFEDQLASAKKCGHMGGKVLVPTSQAIQNLVAARLAADVADVPTVIIARTDALSAQLITSDVDTRDRPFIKLGHADHDDGRVPLRTQEGFHYLCGDPMKRTIARGLAYAPYADLLWFETSEPDVAQARQFADAIRAQFPKKQLAYNCSPSFAWRKHLNDEQIVSFQDELGRLGYAFIFVTLAGWHANASSMFGLSLDYARRGMPAYVDLQDKEFNMERAGYTATRHQREAGTSYFDAIASTISGGSSSTLAMHGSTEAEQFTSHGVGSDHDDREAGSRAGAEVCTTGVVHPFTDEVRSPAPTRRFLDLVADGRKADGEPGAGGS